MQMFCNELELNVAKTELLIFLPKLFPLLMSAYLPYLQASHFQAILKSCYCFHYVILFSVHIARTLFQCLIIIYLDDSNLPLFDLPDTYLVLLKSIQNASVKIIFLFLSFLPCHPLQALSYPLHQIQASCLYFQAFLNLAHQYLICL